MSLMKRSKYRRGHKIPRFIQKLYTILEDSNNGHIIHWTSQENSFNISDVDKFTRKILPTHFKHSNFASFIRQLNMYSFNKVRLQEQGVNVYKNDHFSKSSCSESLKLIRRKQPGEMNLSYNTEYRLQKAADRILQPIKISNFENQFQKYIGSSSINYSGEYEQKCSSHKKDISNSIKGLKVRQSQLHQLCVCLYNENKSLLIKNRDIEAKLNREAKRKEKILDQMIRFLFNTFSREEHKEDTSWEPHKEDVPQMLQQLEDNYQQSCGQENQFFLNMVMKFIEQKEVPQVMRALNKYFRLEASRKKKSYTIVNSSEKLRQYHRFKDDANVVMQVEDLNL